MSNKGQKSYMKLVTLNFIGMLTGLALLVFSSVSNQTITIGFRTDWLFASIGFILVLYYGIFNLKCPYCGHTIDVRGAFYISKCPHCGSDLKEKRE